MKLVVNYYRVDFHIMKDQPPPVPGARVESLAFGFPPFEIRETWTFEVEGLSDLLDLIEKGNVLLTLSKSGYWNSADLGDLREPLYGVAVLDAVHCPSDPRDRPIRIKPFDPSR
ncbi:MAG TPA: hypothetical protein VKR31_10900 [Rhizomicrobium sp.]|nr:hypothetical protein [Rhizomicrobium sp.]